MKKKDLVDIFVREKPYKLLIKLKESKSKEDKNNYCSAFIKSINCTYCYGLNLLRKLNEAGLVSFEKNNKKKIVKLTEKGDKIIDHFKKIKELLK